LLEMLKRVQHDETGWMARKACHSGLVPESKG
jgi:hypothetical protein